MNILSMAPGFFTVDLVHQLFGIFSSGVSVGRTWAFATGRFLFSSETDDIWLGHIKQRPDDSKAGFVRAW